MACGHTGNFLFTCTQDFPKGDRSCERHPGTQRSLWMVWFSIHRHRWHDGHDNSDQEEPTSERLQVVVHDTDQADDGQGRAALPRDEV